VATAVVAPITMRRGSQCPGCRQSGRPDRHRQVACAGLPAVHAAHAGSRGAWTQTGIRVVPPRLNGRRWGRVWQHGARRSRCRRRADHGGGRHRGRTDLDVIVERAAAPLSTSRPSPLAHGGRLSHRGRSRCGCRTGRHQRWPARVAPFPPPRGRTGQLRYHSATGTNGRRWGRVRQHVAIRPRRQADPGAASRAPAMVIVNTAAALTAKDMSSSRFSMSRSSPCHSPTITVSARTSRHPR
jgi:hypothetical protein